MNYTFLKIILWALLGLPVLVVAFYVFIHTFKELKKAEKVNNLNE